MIVLGIDPGTRRVGWGVLETSGGAVKVLGFGCVDATGKGKGIVERAGIIYAGIDEVVRRFTPTCMALEEAFFGRSVKAALRIGEGRGFAMAVAANRGLPVFEYAPKTVKKAAVGTGAAHKSQVQEMIRRALNLDVLPEPDDAADALAVAWCHCNRQPA
ncbi:MAG: crossover junction endodeoxyribonuclease RuvC [Planctomycetota bacterium]|jgi:crossover junction endodeoxyribonuclease RuvC